MKKVILSLKQTKEDYSIVIGNNILKTLPKHLKLLGLPKEIFIITNDNINKRYGAKISRILKSGGFSPKTYCAIDSEKAKSAKNAIQLVEYLAEYAKQKKVTVCALGGGVAGDLAGFIASIYKRGVPLIHIPTSLLSQIDSSVGGKTAIDLKIAKNIIGTFYQPKLVLCDLSLLTSLDKKQIRCGLAEAIKYAVIKDEKLFAFLENKYLSIFSNDTAALEHLVYECVKIKADIVKDDVKEEKGYRTILNFGHTIGHAIETAGDYTGYNHGEAIALGMIAACKISQSLGLLNNNDYQRVINLIIKIGLPQEISRIKETAVLKAYKLDKKFIGKTNRFVLTKGVGKTVIRQNIPEKIIHNAIKELFII